jgi:phytoene dehydrogenase-like protein
MVEYDVIVIGAGCAGLSSAARVAKNNKKVLVLEKHNIPGGCGTSFRRGRFEFEVALHQLSQMGSKEKPGGLRKLFREYGIEEQIEWVEIKDLYNIIQPSANINISLPTDVEEAKKTMSKQFPKEKENIIQYYDLVWGFCKEYFELIQKPEEAEGEGIGYEIKKMVTGKLFGKKYPYLAKYMMRSAQEILDEIGLSKEAQTCVNAYWSFMGSPPERLPFAILAACTYLYILYKPYYLKGGSQVMSQALTEFIRKSGGTVRFNCGVNRILLEGNKAVGVITDEGETIKAKKIISNISPIHTYVNLLETYQVPENAMEYLSHCRVGTSAFSCFIGLDCPPEEIGLTTSFNLMYPVKESGDGIEAIRKLTAEDDPLVVTCYTVDDPSLSPPGTSIISAVALKYAEPWIELSAEQYYETKYKVAQQMVKRINDQFPGFRDHIEEIEVATPLTHMRYLNHPGGAIYGFEQDMNATGFFFPTESKLENLEFASGWARLCGFGPNYLFGDKIANKVLREV